MKLRTPVCSALHKPIRSKAQEVSGWLANWAERSRILEASQMSTKSAYLAHYLLCTKFVFDLDWLHISFVGVLYKRPTLFGLQERSITTVGMSHRLTSLARLVDRSEIVGRPERQVRNSELSTSLGFCTSGANKRMHFLRIFAGLASVKLTIPNLVSSSHHLVEKWASEFQAVFTRLEMEWWSCAFGLAVAGPCSYG